MDTTCSLLVRQTIVGEPERRDDYGLAKGGGNLGHGLAGDNRGFGSFQSDPDSSNPARRRCKE
jgi:hypothetical protein